MIQNHELFSTPPVLCEISSKKKNGRRTAKFVLHEIFDSAENYQDNGISWKKEYTEKNMYSVIGMSLKAEFLDNERNIPFGHGMTGIEDGKPRFKDAVVLGSFKNPKIENVIINEKSILALTAEADIDELTYPNFVKWMEDKFLNNEVITGSVEIFGSEIENPIIYENEYKDKGRVPMDYIYGGYAVISIEPADKSAVVLELNGKIDEEDLKMDKEFEIAFQNIEGKISEISNLETKIAEITTLNEKITELNNTIEALKTQVTEKDNSIVELNEKINTLNTKLVEAEKQSIINELNEQIKNFSDEQKECVKEKIAAFNTSPDKSEINSIVNEIYMNIGKNALESKSNSGPETEINQKEKDIYGDIMEISKKSDLKNYSDLF